MKRLREDDCMIIFDGTSKEESIKDCKKPKKGTKERNVQEGNFKRDFIENKEPLVNKNKNGALPENQKREIPQKEKKENYLKEKIKTGEDIPMEMQINHTFTGQNDCEIIVLNKRSTEYAEKIEKKLKKIGIKVDLLFPNADALLNRLLGHMFEHGSLYAIVISPINEEHETVTVNILHGIPQEHRNMPVENAIKLIYRDFMNKKKGITTVSTPPTPAKISHPESIQILADLLADNRQLTVLQYDKLIKYLEMQKQTQMQFEIDSVRKLQSDINKQQKLETNSSYLRRQNNGFGNNTENDAPPNVIKTDIQKNANLVLPLLENPKVQQAVDNLLLSFNSMNNKNSH